MTILRITKNYHRLTVTFLVLVFIIGFSVRIIGIHNGLPMAFHPDEPHILGPAEQFFTGDWNPHSFNYPSLFMYFLHFLLRLFLVVATWLSNVRLDRITVYLFGRFITVLLATFSILMVYTLGERFVNRRTGLIASFLFALTPLHTIHSHWVITDIPLTLLILLSLYSCGALTEKGQRKNYIIAGLLCGLTISTKIPGLFVLASFVLAHLIFVHRSKELDILQTLHHRITNWRLLWPGLLLSFMVGVAVFWFFSRPNLLLGFLQSAYPDSLVVTYSERAAATIFKGRVVYVGIFSFFVLAVHVFWPTFFRNSQNLILGFVIAVLAFFLTTPYAILDFKHFSQSFFEQALISKTTWGGMFAGTLPGWIYNLRILSAGNSFFAILAFSGLVFAYRDHRVFCSVLGIFMVTYYVYIGSWGLKFGRYMVPLMPLLALFAAIALDKLITIAVSKQNKIRRLVRFTIMAFVVVSVVSITYQFAYECYDYDRYLLKTSTKTLAYNWMIKNIPKDARILREQYTPELELVGYDVTNLDYKFIDIASPEYVQSNQFDYVVISSKLFERPKVARAAKENRNYYEQLEDYAVLIKEIIPKRENPGPLLKIYRVNKTLG